jgi:hypothetical protein
LICPRVPQRRERLQDSSFINGFDSDAHSLTSHPDILQPEGVRIVSISDDSAPAYLQESNQRGGNIHSRLVDSHLFDLRFSTVQGCAQRLGAVAG